MYSYENEFQIGQIVRLKSGGPDMTIEDYLAIGPSGNYRCQWFAGKKLESGIFPKQSLELVNNENE